MLNGITYDLFALVKQPKNKKRLVARVSLAFPLRLPSRLAFVALLKLEQLSQGMMYPQTTQRLSLTGTE
jgi:hypothetical protein